MKTTITLALTALVLLASSITVSADAYKIAWYSVNSGGGVAESASLRIKCSVGQSAAGFAQNAGALHWIGLWSGELQNPTIVDSPAEAKQLANGSYVSLAGEIATSADGDFTGFFYVEESDRSSGIRVVVPPTTIPDLARGKVVNVIGTMGTNGAGERQLVEPMVIVISTDTPPDPVAMRNNHLGGCDLGTPPLGQYGVKDGTGLNNIGLLVQTWGRVTYVDTVADYFYLDDGSKISDGSGHAGVRVAGTSLAVLPELDHYVTVIAVSSMFKPGMDRHRLLLPRADDDVVEYEP